MKFKIAESRVVVWAALLILGIYELRASLGKEPASPKTKLSQYPKDTFSRAHIESDGFFTDMHESDWKKLTERVKDTPKCTRQCEAEEAHRWYQNNWEPSFTCQHERRVGRWGDGGKWICDPHRVATKVDGSCLIYSIGSRNDFSFEEGVLHDISTACEIHTFDPTVGDHPSHIPQHGNVHFHPWGLSNVDNGSYKTLPQIVKDLGHTSREIDILKIDCEGCEWTTFNSWFESGVSIRQILIELHGGTKGGTDPVPAMAFMDYLQEHGYIIFHKEPNTLGCKGSCIEYSFIRLHIPQGQ
jgi:hypothetical protein